MDRPPQPTEGLYRGVPPLRSGSHGRLASIANIFYFAAALTTFCRKKFLPAAQHTIFQTLY